MTDMEIPQAAVEAVYEARGAHRDASGPTGTRCSCGQGFPTAVKQLEHETRALLGAALPHLQADTKAMCETATKVGYGLGRQEALKGVADEMGVEQDDPRIGYVTIQIDHGTYRQLLAARETGKGCPS